MNKSTEISTSESARIQWDAACAQLGIVPLVRRAPASNDPDPIAFPNAAPNRITRREKAVLAAMAANEYAFSDLAALAQILVTARDGKSK